MEESLKWMCREWCSMPETFALIPSSVPNRTCFICKSDLQISETLCRRELDKFATSGLLRTDVSKHFRLLIGTSANAQSLELDGKEDSHVSCHKVL